MQIEIFGFHKSYYGTWVCHFHSNGINHHATFSLKLNRWRFAKEYLFTENELMDISDLISESLENSKK